MHVQGKFADLKFMVFARSKQASIDTHALRNEVTLVWGSLRLAPINTHICMCDVLPVNDVGVSEKLAASCIGWL